MKKQKIVCWLLTILFLLSCLSGCIQPGSLPGGTSGTGAEGTSAPLPEGSAFAVHFIDVGQADAALVLCDGKSMLIDGGNRADGDLIYTYLQKQSLSYLDYVVCTHPDEDHVGGLAAALTCADAGTVYCPVPSYDSKAFTNFADKAAERGLELVRPEPGTVFSLGSAQVTVLAPLADYDDNNNQSIVLRIVYGETSFLFTGDAARESEADMLESGAVLQSTVLKVGHHGSESSTTYPFLREVHPQYAVISVGKDNSYGHPTEEVLSRLRDAGVQVYRTDMQGDIICTSDGKTVTFTTQRGSGALTNPTEGETTGSGGQGGDEYRYIGNLNSKKFHLPTCASLPDEANRIYFLTREQALDAGYTPCGVCRP